MTEKERDFKALVNRLMSPDFGKNFDPQLLHGYMGMVSEAGELINKYKKFMAYPGESSVRTDVLIELSDVLHFMQYILNKFGSSLDELMDINTAKLIARFPEGFTPAKGVTGNRDKAAERAAVDRVVAEYTRRRELEKSSSVSIGGRW